MPYSAPRLFVTLLCVALFSDAGAATLTAAEREALTTRTAAPQPSAQLALALELAVPPWHRDGAPPGKVSLGPEVGKQSAAAALQALDALAPDVPQNDYDRSWLALERASALQALGRDNDARAAYEKVRQMPRNEIQDRQALAALNQLGQTQNPGWCEAGKLKPSHGASQPQFPPSAVSRGIEGWVQLMLDVDADGTIAYAAVQSSSLAAFEQPTIDWFQGQQWPTRDGGAPGRPCFARTQVNFKMASAQQTRFSISQINDASAFTYRSIGAAIRVRAAARDAALAAQKAGQPSADGAAAEAALESASE